MTVGHVDRYSGVQGTGHVQLGQDKQINVKAERSFVGKIVHWIGHSKGELRQEKEANRNVRQDFFVALSKTDKELAKKYSDQLVGGRMESKPLSARLVRQIMDEYQTKLDDTIDKARQVGPKQTRPSTKLASIMEIATKFPERRDDLRGLLRSMINDVSDRRKCNFTEARKDVAQQIATAYENLTPKEKAVFKGTLGEVDGLFDRIGKEIDRHNEIRGGSGQDGGGRVKFGTTDFLIYDPKIAPDTSKYDPEAVPEKGILKKRDDVDVGVDPESQARSAATKWLSEAHDTVLDELSDNPEQYLPDNILTMMQSFNDHLPPERQITAKHFIEHRGMDVEAEAMRRVSRSSKNGEKQLDDDGLKQAIKDGVKSELNLHVIVTELKNIQKDDTLSLKGKAEAAYRLMTELGSDLAPIRLLKTNQMDHYNPLFQENRERFSEVV